MSRLQEDDIWRRKEGELLFRPGKTKFLEVMAEKWWQSGEILEKPR